MTSVSARIASADSTVATPIIVAAPVAQIRIPSDHRKHHPKAIQAFAEDVELHGQRQPIEIVREAAGYRLIFGALRLQAHQYLGRPTIPAIVKEEGQFTSEAAMRLVSISENMNQDRLSALARSVAIADWCAIYRAAQPRLKPGRKPAGSLPRELSLNLILNSPETELMEISGQFAASFSEAAQAFLGISRAGVFRALKIASIPSLQRDRIELHPIADNQSELTALAQIDKLGRQIAVIDLILGGTAGTVEEALDHIDQRPRNTPPKWEKLSEKFARFHESEQDRFFDLQEASITRWQAIPIAFVSSFQSAGRSGRGLTMIAALLSKAATPLIKIGIVFAIGAGLSLGATYFGYRAADKLIEIIVDRVKAAVLERDTYWEGQIAEANLKVALANAAQVNESMRLNSELAAAQEDARQAQEDLKNANAALPGGDAGGLDAQRVQLLNRR